MTAIPIGAVIIDIGGVPEWFMAAAAAIVVYKVWKSTDSIDEIKNDVAKVKHETNSMRSALELASRAEGRLAGMQEQREQTAVAKIAAKETVRADAVEDAKMHAAVLAADPNTLAKYPASVGVIIAGASKTTSGVSDERN